MSLNTDGVRRVPLAKRNTGFWSSLYKLEFFREINPFTGHTELSGKLNKSTNSPSFFLLFGIFTWIIQLSSFNFTSPQRSVTDGSKVDLLAARSSPILKLPKKETQAQDQNTLLLSSGQLALAISCPNSFSNGRVKTFLVCLY